MNTGKISRFSLQDELELIMSLIHKNHSSMFKRDSETNQETFLNHFDLYYFWIRNTTTAEEPNKNLMSFSCSLIEIKSENFSFSIPDISCLMSSTHLTY
jgi:hypothetical protein